MSDGINDESDESEMRVNGGKELRNKITSSGEPETGQDRR
jgi:hypothetical protein